MINRKKVYIKVSIFFYFRSDPDLFFHETDPRIRIRIRINVKRIQNTGEKERKGWKVKEKLAKEGKMDKKMGGGRVPHLNLRMFAHGHWPDIIHTTGFSLVVFDVKALVEQYKCLPGKSELMTRLVRDENVDDLQKVIGKMISSVHR